MCRRDLPNRPLPRAQPRQARAQPRQARAQPRQARARLSDRVPLLFCLPHSSGCPGGAPVWLGLGKGERGRTEAGFGVTRGKGAVGGCRGGRGEWFGGLSAQLAAHRRAIFQAGRRRPSRPSHSSFLSFLCQSRQALTGLPGLAPVLPRCALALPGQTRATGQGKSFWQEEGGEEIMTRDEKRKSIGKRGKKSAKFLQKLVAFSGSYGNLGMLVLFVCFVGC
jgi:hypothetical protein